MTLDELAQAINAVLGTRHSRATAWKWAHGHALPRATLCVRLVRHEDTPVWLRVWARESLEDNLQRVNHTPPVARSIPNRGEITE
jgi:hypothetical protein